jgi:predicted unusual protein kinase regulating ubiquinone biosynthesis (AarF/ABC1/UbiB family)
MAMGRADGRVLRLVRDPHALGAPPVRRAVRSAKLAAVPVALAGRRAAGAGRRVLGGSAADIEHDIASRTAQHMFEVLGDLRGCAAKLGQILSLYELALPAEIAEPYRAALARLHDSAPAMLPRAVHAAMAEQLGRDWRRHFREFDDRHPRAASIGQVHRAIWHDGRAVAVKLQYPGVSEAIESDLAQLRRMSVFTAVLLPGADVAAATEEICARIRDEVDYAREADNQSRFAAAYADDPEFVVPAVVAQRGGVLVSEWIGGTSLGKVIAWGGPQSERDRIAAQVVRFAVGGPRRCGLLYGDPHPGNYRVLPDGRLGVIDFGACAPLPEHFAELALDALDALLNGDRAELAAVVRRRGFVRPGRDFDVAALEEALEPYREVFLRRDFRLTPEWLRARVRESAQLRLSNVYRQLTISADLIGFARMYLSAAGLLAQLDARLSLPDACAELIPGFDEAHGRAMARVCASGRGTPRPDAAGHLRNVAMDQK